MPRGAGGANRQDDVDEEGRGATRRNVGGHAGPRISPSEIGLSSGCADPPIRQEDKICAWSSQALSDASDCD